MNFTPDELSRYSRQFGIPEFGMAGQAALKAGSVLCIGAGGLGSPAITYLAAAGVGRICIVDADKVEASNLHRQLLYTSADVGTWKAEAARDRVHAINPNVEVEILIGRFTRENAADLVSRHAVILDGSDNFATRYLSSDMGVWHKKPNVYASILRFEGQATVFAPHLGGPCYRCFLPKPPAPGVVPTCAESGVLGILPGILGTMQAAEVIKLLTGLGEPLVGRFLHFDALAMKFREFKLRRDPQCSVCGESPSITEAIDYDAFCGAVDACEMKGGSRVVKAVSGEEISVLDLADKLKPPVSQNFLLLDVREPWEREISSIPAAVSIPLGELESRLDEISPDLEIAIHCKSGGRSAKAVGILKKRGYPNVANVAGGIGAWKKEVDPTLADY